MKKIITIILINLTFLVLLTVSASAEDWLWPTEVSRMNTSWITQKYSSSHKGIDIGGVHGSSPIYATKSGTVVSRYDGCDCRSQCPDGTGTCEHGKTLGNYVVIDHGNGVYSRYIHLYKGGVASLGSVKQGDIIGYMGSTGRSTGVHLDFAIYTGGTGVSGGAVLNGTAINVNPTNVYSDGNITYITQANPEGPDTGPPTSATISINKTSLKTGEEFTMTLSSDTETDFYLSIFDADTNEIIIGENVLSTYKNSFQKAGRYAAYMSAFNSKGSIDSNWIEFYVYNNAPTVASLSVNQYAFAIGESIIFTNYADDSCEYYMSIYNSDGEIIDCGNKSQSYTMTISSPGYYSAAMSAHNPLGTAHSNWVSFYVYGDAPTYSTLSIDKTELSVGESITFTNYADDSCEYYMSIYNSDGEIIDCGNKSQSYTMTISSPGYYSAAMSAHNPLGTAHSNWVSFHVYDGAPTYAILSLNEEEIGIGDSAKLITKTDVDYVRVYTSIYKEEELIYSGWISDEFEYTPPEEGIYNICASAYTNSGTLHTNWVNLYVGKYNICYNANGGIDQHPTQNKIYGKTLVIFDEVPIRTGYTFTGWNTMIDGTGIAYDPGDEYIANESTTLYAQWKKEEVYTTTKIKKNGTIHTIEMDLSNISEDYEIIFTGYKDNRFVACTSKAHSQENEIFILDGDFDEIKAMIWDGMNSMKPLYNVDIIPSSEWITG